MKLKEKSSILKVIVVSLIIFALIGTSLIGIFSTGYDASSTDENDLIGKNIEDVVTDERALKIIDIYDDIDRYLDKEISLEGFFLDYDGSKLFGIEFPLSNGEMSMASMTYDLKDEDLVKDISDTDLVKVNGTMKSFTEEHEGHSHKLPRLIIDSVEKIR